MTDVAGAPVVVGVDGSEAALHAVELATQFARERHRSLRVVHAFFLPDLYIPHGEALGAPTPDGLITNADRQVAEAVEHARKLAPELDITADVIVGRPAQTLLEEAERSALVVLGDRGIGGFTGLLLGSIAAQVASHAACPVVVARGEGAAGADVVVGVDTSPESARAVEFAMTEAALRGVGITAVHAYQFPVADDPGDVLPLVYDPEILADDEALILSEAISGWRDRFPDVEIHQLVVRDRATRALVHASAGAGLVVVGSRGHGGFTGLLLGSISQALLHHSHCPVAVIR